MSRQREFLALLIAAMVVFVSAAAVANQAPVARISAHRPDGASGSVVLYDGSGSSDADGQVVKFQWVFGDGTTGSGSAVTHAYPQAGLFPVTLLVWDDGGASALLTQTIDIAALPAQSEAGTSAGTGSMPVSPNMEIAVGPQAGLRAPDISLPDLSGGTVSLSTYLGRPVLVEFWLSTCPGCVASTPQLEVYRSTYSAAGLVVMLVVLDRNPSSALTFLYRKYHYTGFVLAWESDARRPTAETYEVPGTPYTFLIDRTGVIRYAGRPDGLSDELIAQWM